MRYGTIPGIDPDKKVSRIAQGTVMLNDNNAGFGFELFDAVLEAGITLFDSAHVYGGGGSDRTFGKWVNARGIRGRGVLMDKCCHHSFPRACALG